MIFSADQGRTWGDAVLISQDPANRIFYWDQRPDVLADETVLDLFWTYDNAAAKYLNIHARASRDSGRAWGNMWDTGAPGQPAGPRSLPDGRIVMVYVDRTGQPHLKGRLSTDGGKIFDPQTEFSIESPELSTQTRRKQSMQEAWSEMADFSLGLPATASLPNGEVIVVYYNGPERDSTDIQWCRLTP